MLSLKQISMGSENRINHPMDPRTFYLRESRKEFDAMRNRWRTGFYITPGGELSFETKQYNGSFWAELHVTVRPSVCYLSEARE